ncbi:hypothetical protein WJX84_007058 [Apatococcus fuscideae]|uniref:Fe2OG dioxygenase domain-containing protein n=1 Tax=Apatococcus fuscideae TaxID=2026836 RepID=A0AAW1SX41_9CHLO
MVQTAEITFASAPQRRLQGAAPKRSTEPLSSIPVIDMAQPDRLAAEQLATACSTVGFFYVCNHGVEESIVKEQFAQSHAFFDLPVEEKLKIKANASQRGYYPYSMGSAKNSKGHHDQKEAFNVYGFESDQSDLPFHGHNLWPPVELLPRFRPAMLAYYAAMNQVATRILRLLGLALHLGPDYFLPKFTSSTSNIRCVHYLPQRSQPDEGVCGVGAHTDWGMLTVLATDSQPGLQISHDGAWIDVEPRPGHFVINIGDLLDRWTGGKFCSTLHRVVNQTGLDRYSCPFFLAPAWDAKIEPLPGIQDPTINATNTVVTCGEWLSMRRAAEYGGQPLLAML